MYRFNQLCRMSDRCVCSRNFIIRYFPLKQNYNDYHFGNTTTTTTSTSCSSRAWHNQQGQLSTSTHHCQSQENRSTKSSFSSHDYYDIVISGGGMVGTSLASALGHDPLFAGKKVLLLESMQVSTNVKLTEKYSNRVCALSPATAEFLGGLGAWDEIEAMRSQPVIRMQVWDACSDAMITFDRDEGPLAYIVENDVILEALKRSLSSSAASVEVRYGTLVQGCQLPHQLAQTGTAASPLVEMKLNSGDVIKTQLLIAADGANSFLRKIANMHHVGWEYGAAGIVATLHLAEPGTNNCAWQRFLPSGPIALLPLSETRSSLVWSTSTEEADRLLKLPPNSFVDAINQAYLDDSDKNRVATSAHEFFNELFSAFSPDNKAFNRQFPPRVIDVDEASRAVFPLGLGHASRYVESRFALIGDSAHRVHPLAGQGVNLGFADAACLTEVLRGALSRGADLGSIHHLLEYETSRQRHVIPVMATIDGLSRLYGTTFTPIVLARTLGLQATNAITPIKDWLMKYAVSHP